MKNLKETVLTFNELESIRLIDFENMRQDKAGKKMKISQSTLSRLLKSARRKLADAGRGRLNAGGRLGRQGGFGAGPSGFCVCPQCGYKEKHQIGVSCYNKKCPKCGSSMTRE